MTLIASLIVMMHSCIQSQDPKKNTSKTEPNTKIVGGPCEGCDAATDYGDKVLNWTDTIKGFDTSNNKIKINGTVFRNDGQTPAEGIIVYVYHTDHTGRYPTKSTSTGLERRHGYMRTWLRTDADGRYEFYTSRPASYPNSTVPQHIHVTIKEPGLNSYYIEDFFFADDPNLTSDIKKRSKPRGGSGVIQLKGDGTIKTATRDIILGLHIPDY
ncbi:intradiol ring-cleavage dioxygenase [Psychroserpens sp. XS_ASV72]|uniref:dioxygenase family protein n=1 Tax=Psychroserpens sp. XS_ASV72 TaxID=3241293 RepID=UPI003512A85D